MVAEIPLLEVMRVRMGAFYLSDLRLLPSYERMRLARVAADIPATSASIREWNGALLYVSGIPPEQTAEAARERLIQSLSQPGTQDLGT